MHKFIVSPIYIFASVITAIMLPTLVSAESNTSSFAIEVLDTKKGISSKSEEYTEKVLPVQIPNESNPNAMDDDDIELYFSENDSDDVLPPEKQLSPDTKATLKNISKNINKSKNKPVQTIVIDHEPKSTTSYIKGNNTSEEKKTFAISLKEKEKKPLKAEALNAQAYHALMAGQTEAAASLYKRALKMAPKNYAAQFGLATTYHRNKQYNQARSLYSKILAKHPHDTDTLNNFLMLIAEEAPEDALKELRKLEKNNSDYSPVTAQIGMLYMKLGKEKKAIRYLKQAIAISPSNASYRYNLAILLDKMQRYKEAAALYRQLLAAAGRGATIPGDISKMYKRLQFIEAQQ